MTLDRRGFLRAGLGITGTVAFGAFIPQISSAAGARDPRFITLILRGALDGLAAVPPIGDPGFSSLGRDALTGTTLPLDGMFALHPSLVNFQRQYKAGQAAVVHASATAYRDRSHFDGQDVLESGYAVPGRRDSGWMNRLLGQLPKGQRASSAGLSVGSTTPLALRGPAEVMGWAPTTLPVRDDNLPMRIMALYQESDPDLARAFDTSMATAKLAQGATGAARGPGMGPMTATARGAARLLAREDGPRVAALSFMGWDTHASEASRLASLLTDLDGALAQFETTLGGAWRDTTILVATEFGRTAAVNGTKGTDHGTGAAAFLVGGAVKGGQVITDWPGLRPTQLRDNRDLAPTTDLRAVTKGLLSGIYDLSPAALAEVFPDSEAATPTAGVIA